MYFLSPSPRFIISPSIFNWYICVYSEQFTHKRYSYYTLANDIHVHTHTCALRLHTLVKMQIATSSWLPYCTHMYITCTCMQCTCTCTYKSVLCTLWGVVVADLVYFSICSTSNLFQDVKLGFWVLSLDDIQDPSPCHH